MLQPRQLSPSLGDSLLHLGRLLPRTVHLIGVHRLTAIQLRNVQLARAVDEGLQPLVLRCGMPVRPSCHRSKEISASVSLAFWANPCSCTATGAGVTAAC